MIALSLGGLGVGAYSTGGDGLTWAAIVGLGIAVDSCGGGVHKRQASETSSESTITATMNGYRNAPAILDDLKNQSSRYPDRRAPCGGPRERVTQLQASALAVENGLF